MTRQENWTAFLYLLMRDHVTLGHVAHIVEGLETRPQDRAVFANNGLHASAEEFMRRIDSL